MLIIWIRLSLREPAGARPTPRVPQPEETGSRLLALVRPPLLSRTLVGIGLAAVGLATFWGVHIYGKDMLRRQRENEYLAALLAQGPDVQTSHHLRQLLWESHHDPSDVGDHIRWVRARLTKEEVNQLLEPYREPIKQAENFGFFLVTIGGGLGLVSFGPLCEWLGRRGAFLFFQIGGLLIALLLFQVLPGTPVLVYALPVFGFLTLGMHAGFAVYFPELFPTWLRGSGTGVCFNGGRVLAAPVLILGGWVQRTDTWGWSLETSASVLSLLFLIGPLLLLAAPETWGTELE